MLNTKHQRTALIQCHTKMLFVIAHFSTLPQKDKIHFPDPNSKKGECILLENYGTENKQYNIETARLC